MNDRVAIVTGGTRGIGAAITDLLTADGTHVAAVYAGNHDAARDLADRTGAAGGSVSVHPGDIGDPGFCRALVAGLVADRGRVDHLVNNAGLLVENSVRRMTDEEWDGCAAGEPVRPVSPRPGRLEPMTEPGSAGS